MSRPVLRRAATAVAAVALLPAAAVLTAAPASAAPPSSTVTKSSGGTAEVAWTEYDLGDSLGLPGNTHVGFLGVYQQPGFTQVFGQVVDFQCDAGEVPGGHGEPGTPGFCDLVQVRPLQSDGGATFTATSTAATLTGTILVGGSGHGEPGDPGVPVVTVPVQVTWTATGELESFRRSETWTRGTTTYRSRVTGKGYDATVTGRMGRMDFAAEDGDGDSIDYAHAESWRESSRFVVRP